jgi:hypothetical protein
MSTRFRLPSATLARLVLACLAFSLSAGAEGPRVLPAGQLPADERLKPLKDLDGYFPFQPPTSMSEWEKRAERVRRQMLVALGLWPMPDRTPLNVVMHGKVDRDNYTVERVFFESHPGFFVTGSLYRPKGRSGKLPGVLFPHGHWAEGRFFDQGVLATRKEIVQGAERFEEGGRSLLQSLCVGMARMGCVVFHYDMIGYADSLQLSFDLAHRFSKQRPEMNTVENWGLFSPQAETHLQSIMGLQAWNSMRALDFLLTLPEVDTQRIAVTGASGGGTQTFTLGALDSRVALAFPAVMVSTAMQGGCTCENCSLFRVDTGNIEFAALFAPKPMGMTAANDWTKEMATKGFPELQQHYKFFGAPNNVMLKSLTHFGHNYNYVSRAAMYSWVNKHFKLGLEEPIVEEDYRRLSRQEMTVWSDQYSKPPSGPDFERKLLRYVTEQSDRQLREARKNPTEYRRIVLGALEVMVGRGLEQAGKVEFQLTSKNDRGSYIEMLGLLKNTSHREELPIVYFYPKQWKGRTVVWLDGDGKSALYSGGSGAPVLWPELRKLVESGSTVIGVDLIYQGEFLPDGQAVKQTRTVKNPREFAGYTHGYNSSVFAQRVQDVLSVIQHIQAHDQKTANLAIVGLNGAGPVAAAAQALARDVANELAVDTREFRFAKLTDFRDPNFLPGGAKYDDLPGILAAGTPRRLHVAGEGSGIPALLSSAYAGASDGRRYTRLAGTGDKLVGEVAGILFTP